MPGLDGYEVVRRIRQICPGSIAKLIAITGWGQEHDKMRALGVGFDYHLTKPVDLQRLYELISPESDS